MVTHKWLPESFRKCWNSVILSFWPYRRQDISKIYVNISLKWRKAFFFPYKNKGHVNKMCVRCFISSHTALHGPPLPIVLISSPPAQSLSQALSTRIRGLFIKHSYQPGTLDSIRDEILGPFAKSALAALCFSGCASRIHRTKIFCYFQVIFKATLQRP